MKLRYTLVIALAIALLSVIYFCLEKHTSKNSQAQTPNQSQNPCEITSIIDSTFGFELVKIPTGTLKKEANHLEIHAIDYQIECFYIGKFEVTQKLWKEVMGVYPQPFDFNNYPLDNARHKAESFERYKEIATPTGFIGDNLPVETISWEAANEFVKKLSELTGHYYRLPTSAEWEYAYRAGTTTSYYFGNDTLLLDEYEWYRDNAEGKTHAVGLKKPNPWGLYDMGGNVGEWTRTIADMEPWRRMYPQRDWGIARRRDYKGSHYLHSKHAANATWTHTFTQVYPHECVGLRVVREIR